MSKLGIIEMCLFRVLSHCFFLRTILVMLSCLMEHRLLTNLNIVCMTIKIMQIN